MRLKLSGRDQAEMPLCSSATDGQLWDCASMSGSKAVDT